MSAPVRREAPVHELVAPRSMISRVSGLSAIATYVGRIREFRRVDWIVYTAWVGLMVGLVVTGGVIAVAFAATIPLVITVLAKRDVVETVGMFAGIETQPAALSRPILPTW